MNYQDYYKILGIKKTDDAATIKKAYRTLSKKYHPDQSSLPGAEEKFKEVNAAYQVLSDPEKKRQYDLLGDNYHDGQNFRPPPGWGARSGGFGGNHAGGGFSDLFEQFFQQQNAGQNPFGQTRRSRPSKGKNIELVMQVSMEEIYHGHKHPLRFQTRMTRADGGQQLEAKSYDVTIPAGVAEGDKIRLKGKGNASFNGGANGDLILTVHILKHALFSPDHFNLKSKLAITASEAALGAKIPMQTLDGKITLSIPACSNSGKKFRLKNKGLRKNKTERGHLDVEIQIVWPEALEPSEIELFEKLAEVSTFKARH